MASFRESFHDLIVLVNDMAAYIKKMSLWHGEPKADEAASMFESRLVEIVKSVEDE